MTAHQTLMFGDALDDAFLAWCHGDDANTVISRFTTIAREQMNRGRRGSAKGIIEQLRYSDDPISFNNKLTSRLVRYVVSANPELAGFFKMRELTAHKKRRP